MTALSSPISFTQINNFPLPLNVKKERKKNSGINFLVSESSPDSSKDFQLRRNQKPRFLGRVRALNFIFNASAKARPEVG
jgi:hypothetical protein